MCLYTADNSNLLFPLWREHCIYELGTNYPAVSALCDRPDDRSHQPQANVSAPARVSVCRLSPATIAEHKVIIGAAQHLDWPQRLHDFQLQLEGLQFRLIARYSRFELLSFFYLSPSAALLPACRSLGRQYLCILRQVASPTPWLCLSVGLPTIRGNILCFG